LPILQKGGAGIQGWIDEQKKLGGILGDDQYAAAGKAVKSWKVAKEQISAAFEGVVGRAAVVAAPLVGFVGKAISKVISFVTPIFDWYGRAWGRIGDIVGAVFGQLEKWFHQFTDWLKELGGEVGVFTDDWPTIEDVIVSVFRAIGTAGAYAWDTIKAGAGAVTYAASYVVDGFGLVVKVFKEVVSLAKELPEDLRPKGLDNFIAGVEKFESGVSGAAGKMREQGKAMIDGFGSSAGKFNSWLDNALAKQKTAAEEVKGAAADLNAEMKQLAGAALLKGSSAEVSARVKYEFGGKSGTDKLAEGQKKGNDLLKSIDGGVKGLGKMPGGVELLPF
jgi:hypothetical protein